MAQMPPHLGPVCRTIVEGRPVTELIYRTRIVETLALPEGVYILTELSGVLEGGHDETPDVTLSLQIETAMPDQTPLVNALLQLHLSGQGRQDRFEFPERPSIIGPIELRFIISSTTYVLDDDIAEDPYEGATISIQIGVEGYTQEDLDDMEALEHHDPLVGYIDDKGLSVITDDGTDLPYLPSGSGLIGDVSAVQPHDPAPGTSYLDTDRNQMMVYTGEQWEEAEPEETMPRIRGVRERRHQPFWDQLSQGDLGSDSTIVLGGPARSEGAVERTDQTWYDTYLCDAARGGDFCPQHMTTGHKRLFQTPSRDPFICNVPDPGIIPHESTFIVSDLGLSLHFSDPELYPLAFRYLRAELHVMQHLQRDVHAQEWLAAAVKEDEDDADSEVNPSLGFSWMLNLDRAIPMPAHAEYYVHLHLAEPLVERLREAEEALQRYNNTGEWETPEHEERFSRWYAEIRILLGGLRARRMG